MSVLWAAVHMHRECVVCGWVCSMCAHERVCCVCVRKALCFRCAERHVCGGVWWWCGSEGRDLGETLHLHGDKDLVGVLRPLERRADGAHGLSGEEGGEVE